jgi:hypothetical protein
VELTISSVDHAPGDLTDQVPLRVALLRQLPGPDRPDYWLGAFCEPVRWVSDHEGFFEITHVVLTARWQGTSIGPGCTSLPVGIAYVVDMSLLDDDTLDFAKCRYVAIGIVDDTTAGRPVAPLTSVLAGNIARLFGTGRNGEQ